MNHRQKLVLASFIVATLLIGSFPPWRWDIGSSVTGIHRAIGFHFLFSAPHWTNDQGYYYEAHIDTAKLMVELVTLILVSFALLLMFRGPLPKRGDNE
jgi:hypothetical protein